MYRLGVVVNTNTMIHIQRATYGGADCTNQIRQIADGKSVLFIRADNHIIGDPFFGKKKELIITIDDDSYVTGEGEFFAYPKMKNKRLGVWYSNNHDAFDPNPILKSLDTIKHCSKDTADIVTCVWNKIINNPFVETISWYRITSHLTQILQIMQSLSVAKTIGSHEYVSFLEHDVMYPEGYFDFPDFEDGEVIINNNYGGICKRGWQETMHKSELPMHQMTMKINDAINHLKNILEEALVSNSGNIEPKNLKKSQWSCKNQSIHINHGNHMTSHYTTYDTSKNLKQHHPYWGSHSDYLYLFK